MFGNTSFSLTLRPGNRNKSSHQRSRARRVFAVALGLPFLFALASVVYLAMWAPPSFGPRPCSAESGANVLVVGDSILAFNASTCGSIADVLSRDTNHSAVNAAQSGAMLAPDGYYFWGDIRQQYVEGDWDWVVINGGVNDLNNGCGCGECEGILSQLASEDGATGEMPFLVGRALAGGARVLIVGYYDIPDTAGSGFGRCADWVDKLNARYRLTAEGRENVHFVEGASAMNFADDPDAYYIDHVHPSKWGSELVGGLLVNSMLESGL